MSKEQVKCHSCSSTNLEYDGRGSDHNGNGICWNWTCKDCGSQGVDCYTPEFTPQYIVETGMAIYKRKSE